MSRNLKSRSLCPSLADFTERLTNECYTCVHAIYVHMCYWSNVYFCEVNVTLSVWSRPPIIIYFIYTVTHLAITRSSLTPFLLSVVHRWLLLLHDTRSLAKMRIIRSPRYDTSDATLPKTRLVAITRTVFAQIEKRHSRRALFSYYRSIRCRSWEHNGLFYTFDWKYKR